MKLSLRGTMGLFVVLATVVAQACDLPSAEPGKTSLELRFVGPDTILMNDTIVLEVEARDPQGRVLLEPPVRWVHTPPDGWNPLTLVRAEYGRVWVVGLDPRPGEIQVQIPETDPQFTSKALVLNLPVGFEPMTVRFVNVGRDTLLTRRGPFQLSVSAVDQKGRYPRVRGTPYGDFTTKILRGRVSRRYVSEPLGTLDFNADSAGTDTIILSHTTCPNPCADTLVVQVEPQPTEIAFPAWEPFESTSLADTVKLYASLVDASGTAFPDSAITWRLVEPGDSTILDVLPAPGTGPSYASVVTRSDGTARLAAASAGVEGQVDFRVHQEPRTVQLKVPPHVVGVGTDFSARFVLLDGRGNLIPSSRSFPQEWTNESDIGIVETHQRDAQLETRHYGFTPVFLQVQGCRYADSHCWWVQAAGQVDVIAEPDSVRAYVESGGTILGGAGTTALLLGDIYLPDDTIDGVPLFWRSLSPSVAVVDEDGLVTAVSPGTARIVGTMGAAADTVAFTVTANGP